MVEQHRGWQAAVRRDTQVGQAGGSLVWSHNVQVSQARASDVGLTSVGIGQAML